MQYAGLSTVRREKASLLPKKAICVKIKVSGKHIAGKKENSIIGLRQKNNYQYKYLPHFYPQYGRACFITGIKEGMFITMIMRALTHSEYY